MQRVVFLLLLFLLSTVIVGQVTALNGKIVFETNRDGNDEIYVMDADGGNLRNLTRHPARDIRPEWSPDGKQIAFISNRSGNEEVLVGNDEIYVMDADGGNLRNLTRHPARDIRPDWSPDGKQVAFISNRSENEEILIGNDEIYVMDADGGNLRNLTQHPGFDSYPDWSPDGKQILFLSNRDGGINTYIMDADGQNVRRLTNYPPDGEFADNPVWSPDGKWIAFEWVQVGGSGIYVMNPNGKDVHPVSPPVAGFSKGHAEWSPDGTQIVYFAWKDNKVWAGTLMLATRVREKRWESERVALPLPEEFLLNTVCWSPAGKHLLFGGGHKVHRRTFYDIYRYTFETGEIVQLTDHPARVDFAPDWSAHALSVSLEGNIATYWGQIKAAGRQ